ncbi:hypothetical protein CAPTEDRAFT_87652, partial [Capitella teleta]
ITGWAKAASDGDPWIQVDLLRAHRVITIATWGRLGGNEQEQYTKTYTISHSVNSDVWEVFTENGLEKIFIGNSDGVNRVENNFSEPIHARFVRLHPREFYSYRTLRWDVIVC